MKLNLKNKLDSVRVSASWTTSGPCHRRLPGILPSSCRTFVNYEKAFDSVETNAILSTLVDQGASFHCSLTIATGKGVRQGDTILPKPFAAALQWIMKSFDWEERGMRVDLKFLSNLLFADDIVPFTRAE
ncbi:hypothetical protein RB195_001999 [Necator americanus]|uniref:Reverse transcriptase domain-containing protein n=1 Tax=Necator americanus TaxID=51031 RepID=A0ABR1DGX2_NECAM